MALLHFVLLVSIFSAWVKATAAQPEEPDTPES